MRGRQMQSVWVPDRDTLFIRYMKLTFDGERDHAWWKRSIKWIVAAVAAAVVVGLAFFVVWFEVTGQRTRP